MVIRDYFLPPGRRRTAQRGVVTYLADEVAVVAYVLRGGLAGHVAGAVEGLEGAEDQKVELWGGAGR